MIDSHAHIHDEQFDADREAVLQRAREAGVSRIITVGTSVKESHDAIALAESHENIFATVAVHPEEYTKLPDEKTREMWRETIARLAKHEKVVAIGECGLDYHAFGGIALTDEQKVSQKLGFRDHLELAKQVKKPIVIHARESYEDVLEMVRECVADIPAVIMHCYQGDAEITQKFLNLDSRIVFSFSGSITYPVKRTLQGTKDDPSEVIRIIPLDRILTETDCPYLAPQDYRGTRNEPAYIVSVVRKIAEVKGILFEEGEKILERNIKRNINSL